jgi:guanylate kinase
MSMARLSARPQTPPAVDRRGMMFVLSSPSGAGKSTLSRMLLEDPRVELSISVTTRPQRSGEVGGQHYHFIDKARFDDMVRNGELLEWAHVFGNFYGSPRAPVEKALAVGRDVLFDVDWQGTRQIRDRAGSDVVSVFVLPPSVRELERRLHSRAQDSDAVIRGRMERASDEMSHWTEYDYVVINNDINRTFAELSTILAAERLKREHRIGRSFTEARVILAAADRLKRERQSGLSEFVRSLQREL